MPYISHKLRDGFLNGDQPTNVGELNFAITTLMIDYAVSKSKINYELLNGIIGAVESAKAEFQRRVVAGYEDSKIAENGDVYPPTLLFGQHEYQEECS